MLSLATKFVGSETALELSLKYIPGSLRESSANAASRHQKL